MTVLRVILSALALAAAGPALAQMPTPPEAQAAPAPRRPAYIAFDA